MRSLVCPQDLDILLRDVSDFEFRRLYRLRVMQEDRLPLEVWEHWKEALLALVSGVSVVFCSFRTTGEVDQFSGGGPAELRRFFEAGVDGVFADDPLDVAKARGAGHD
jgi:glycerophosphoryl diester phosphodiesterase